ncbi:MAG: hypothetical protein ACR2PR_06355 [Pseudohongiellaceae bacterium]
MPFDPNALVPLGGVSASLTPQLWGYTTPDTATEVETADYFGAARVPDAPLNNTLIDGDIIFADLNTNDVRESRMYNVTGSTAQQITIAQMAGGGGVSGSALISTTSGATFNVLGGNGRPRVIRHSHTTNSVGTFTGIGNLAVGEAESVRIYNNSNTGSISMAITGDAIFDGRITSRLLIEPGRSQDFTIMNLAGVLAVGIESAARHRFSSEPLDVLTNGGLVMPQPPLRVRPILNNTGAADEMVIQPFFSGLVTVTFEGTPNYVGNSNAAVSLVSVDLFLDGSILNPSVGGQAELSVQRVDPSEPRAQILRTWTHVPCIEGNALSFDFRGLSDTAGEQMRMIDVAISWDIEV